MTKWLYIAAVASLYEIQQFDKLQMFLGYLQIEAYKTTE